MLTGPRTGFFHNFTQKEILAKRFDAQKEQFINDVSQEEIERFRSNLQNMDRHLGAYPYNSWKKWISLSSKISSETVSRLEPINGEIHSVTELLPSTCVENKEEEREFHRHQTNDEKEAKLVSHIATKVHFLSSNSSFNDEIDKNRQFEF